MKRRRRKLYQWLPWVAAAVIVLGTGVAFYRSVGQRDYVAIASALRTGDPVAKRARDPLAAIQVLDRFLESHPGHFRALVELAQAQADLRAWDRAVEALERAVADSQSPREQADALTLAMDYLVSADRFDDAVAFGQRAVELQPDEALRVLRLGTTYLKGSVAAQNEVLGRFVDTQQMSVRDVEVEQRIEAFITELWTTPDVDALMDWIMPDGDPVVRQHLATLLVTARERFERASSMLAGYRDYGGFDPVVSRAFAQLLYRSGRLYEAFIEAGMALREPVLNLGVAREFHELQARCLSAVGQHAQAADRYETIIDLYAEDPAAPVPYGTAYSLYAERVLAEQWDWILEHVDEGIVRFGKDPLLRYARAAALEAQGRIAEAREDILDCYPALALGNKRLTAISLRSSPERRRAIAMLAYRLFTATGDSRAAGALDTVLAHNPRDPEALRLRAALALAQGRPDAAEHDARQLLSAGTRDHEDFERWWEAADALSLQRFGRPLRERAARLVDESEQWQRERNDASFVSYSAQFGHNRGTFRQAALPDQLHVRQDPAFSFAIVEELAARENLPRARNELRKLCDAYPDILEFRYRLGRLLVREGQYASAATEFRRLLDVLPRDSEVLELATRTELALGHPQEAALLINRTILDDPLGAGAVRYGQRLVEQGHADQAQALIERLVRWTDYDERIDVLVLAARVQLALGRLPEAEALLATLAARSGDSVEVALLGLDVGLAKDSRGLVDAAVAALRPLAAELFPDQAEQIATRLLDAKLYPELLAIFDETMRTRPAARPALRAVADACKSLGRHEEADVLLGQLAADDADPDALLDRFLLLGLRGEIDEASRRLRLEPVPPSRRNLAELLGLLGNAMLELPVLQDDTPGARLRTLRADERLSAAGVELLDSIVRLVPALRRLADVRPKALIETPLEVYPHAGRDVAALVELARRDPAAARELCRTLLYLLLLGERPFWERESQLLAEQALRLAPGLALPTRILAERDLTDGRPRDALLRLQPQLQTTTPDVADLALFLRAARDFGHSEWGVAYALFFEQHAEVQQLLGETLLEWGHPEEAFTLFTRLAGAQEATPEALAGLIRSMTASRRLGDVLSPIERALATWPEHRALTEACAEALALLPRPDERAVQLMQLIDDRRDDLPAVSEALARAQTADQAAVQATLERMIERMAQQPLTTSTAATQARSITLVRAARDARASQLPNLARQLTRMALQIEPAAINLYRDLASLEQADGHLDTARRYLEVLSFVDLGDRASAMELASMDFRQLGQPIRAAEVVRRTFPGGIPPDGVEIVAAEACLLGQPMDAINAFAAIQRSPLITVDTYLTVARIAYASGFDDIARPLFQYVAGTLPEDDPRRPRAQWLLDARLNVAPRQAAAASAAP